MTTAIHTDAAIAGAGALRKPGLLAPLLPCRRGGGAAATSVLLAAPCSSCKKKDEGTNTQINEKTIAKSARVIQGAGACMS